PPFPIQCSFQSPPGLTHWDYPRKPISRQIEEVQGLQSVNSPGNFTDDSIVPEPEPHQRATILDFFWDCSDLSCFIFFIFAII
ncbi:hypothetical protein U1Q18_036027, partial [Sarracenia purpurea var. burkii]